MKAEKKESNLDLMQVISHVEIKVVAKVFKRFTIFDRRNKVLINTKFVAETDWILLNIS